MREVVAGEHPVRVHSAEVLHLKLDERLGELGRVSKVPRKGVSLKLVASAEDVHAQLNEYVHGGQNIGEQNEPNDDGSHISESEVRVERVVVDEHREQRKDVEEVELRRSASYLSASGIKAVLAYLRDTKESSSVSQAPVSEFMGQNGSDLLSLALLDQRIVNNNVLLPRQTEEVGIAVRTALASIDNIQLGERELELLGQCLNGCLKFSGFQWGELVEQGRDEDGPDGDHEHL